MCCVPWLWVWVGSAGSFQLPEIDRHEGYTLTGVVDPLAERRDEALARYGAPAHDNLRDSLEQVEADLVVLALPTTLHAEQAEWPSLPVATCSATNPWPPTCRRRTA